MSNSSKKEYLFNKLRNGSKIFKKHDDPKTPFQRLIDSNCLKYPKMKKYLNLYYSLDPFLLQESLKNQILAILKLVGWVIIKLIHLSTKKEKNLSAVCWQSSKKRKKRLLLYQIFSLNYRLTLLSTTNFSFITPV